MTTKEVKEAVKNHTTRFSHYQDGNLWYKTDSGVEYPIPIEDAKGGIFLRDDKAVFHMRWIRKHINTIGGGDESDD